MEGQNPDVASQGELLPAGDDGQGRPAEGTRCREVHLRRAAPALPRRARRTAEAVRVGALRLRPGDLLEGRNSIEIEKVVYDGWGRTPS